MPRRAERFYKALPVNVPQLVGTVPAGHKWEIVGFHAHSNQVAVSAFYLLGFDGVRLLWLDALNMALSDAVRVGSYQCSVLYAGDSLYVEAGSAGAPTCDCVIDYIDVTF